MILILVILMILIVDALWLLQMEMWWSLTHWVAKMYLK